MKTIIVEDEITSQQYLIEILEYNFPDIEILAIADNVPEAVEEIIRLRPDIIFMDVNIKKGTGFDVLARLPEITAEIIFTTAFNQFAIDAFRYHAVDYLLKPLIDKQVIEAVKLCRSRIEQQTRNQQIISLLRELKQPGMPQPKIGIPTADGINFFEFNDIVFAEAKGSYTELRLKNGTKITTSKKLKEIEESLTQPVFFRIHNSYVVNIGYIKKYLKGRGGYVVLTDDTSLPVSSTRKDEFLKQFGG
ncbi:LytR/AlgR family response regulator transcription factor [Chitinophagaceae bacterium MMS25-I14]